MTASNYQKLLKQLQAKPAIMQRFIKHCKPKERKFGISTKPCSRCGRFGAHISSHGIHLCRQCFREAAKELGFRKYY
jgi:small subunit ribosomal protein S14